MSAMDHLGVRFFAAAALIVVGAAVSVSAQASKPELRDELVAMEKVDQAERPKCAAGDMDAQIKCGALVQEKVDVPNTKRLEQIFEQHGLPDTKMVDRDGLHAFMLLLQHCTSDALRERAEPSIAKAFRNKELSAQEYAGFVDRLRLHQGKGQIYGTGFESKDGKLVLSKTDDPQNLEKRRREIGLPPMSEYVKMLVEMYKLEVELPRFN